MKPGFYVFTPFCIPSSCTALMTHDFLYKTFGGISLTTHTYVVKLQMITLCLTEKSITPALYESQQATGHTQHSTQQTNPD